MASKNFILLSLEDKKTKKIANVVSNESCRKILDFLSQHEATESELANKLQIPISTIHYNLQQLMDTGLINAEEYHYSEKGKEVYHYTLANKYIIITPKKTRGIGEKLRGILPVTLIVAATAGIIQLSTKYFSKGTFVTQEISAAKSIAAEDVAAPSLAQTVTETATEAAPVAVDSIPLLSQNIALWFLVGALFTIIVYIIWIYFKKE